MIQASKKKKKKKKVVYQLALKYDLQPYSGPGIKTKRVEIELLITTSHFNLSLFVMETLY